MIDVYIRPLSVDDAKISYKWRNDPEIWKLTGSKPEKIITLDIEAEWIKKVITLKDEKRFAICIRETDEYIGNVQLTGINQNDAEFHIFIGEKKYWGKGVATSATGKILDYAKNVLKIKIVYLHVNEKNIHAIKAYNKNGFEISCKNYKMIKMIKIL